jgi:hypothetical protein
MVRRWLIRLPFLLALALVVGVWITSHIGLLYTDKRFAGRLWTIFVIQGLATFDVEAPYTHPDEPFSFDFSRKYTAKDVIPMPTTLGFYAGRWRGEPDTLLLIFPLWLPSVMLSGLNWFVWRKTRAKYNGRGFPVEPTQSPAKSE